MNIDIIEPLGASDHNMVLCELSMVSKDLPPAGELLKRRNYQHANWNLFQHYLLQGDWETIFSFPDIDFVWISFSKTINELLDIVVPIKHPKSKASSLRWETRAAHSAGVLRNKAERKYLSDKSTLNKNLRNQTSKSLKQATNFAVKNFECKLAHNSDAKPFWYYVNS